MQQRRRVFIRKNSLISKADLRVVIWHMLSNRSIRKNIIYFFRRMSIQPAVHNGFSSGFVMEASRERLDFTY